LSPVPLGFLRGVLRGAFAVSAGAFWGSLVV